MRIADEDDVREDLELAVIELRDQYGLAHSSIRRYVNGALKATEIDGYRATPFLARRWKREQDREAAEKSSGPVGRAV